MHSEAVTTVPLFLLKAWFFVILILKFRPLSNCHMGMTCYLKCGMDWICISTWSAPGGLSECVFHLKGIRFVSSRTVKWEQLGCWIWKLAPSPKPGTDVGAPKCLSLDLTVMVPLDPPFKCTDFTTAHFKTLAIVYLFIALIQWVSSLQQFVCSPPGPQLASLSPTGEGWKKSIWKHFSLAWLLMENKCSLQTKLICKSDEALQ